MQFYWGEFFAVLRRACENKQEKIYTTILISDLN